MYWALIFRTTCIWGDGSLLGVIRSFCGPAVKRRIFKFLVSLTVYAQYAYGNN